MNPNNFSQYVGRYKRNDDSVVYVFERNETLIIRPILWTSALRFHKVRDDSFVAFDFPDRSASFPRDESGRVSAIDISGMNEADGTFVRMDADEQLPVELLFAEDAEKAVSTWVQSQKIEVDLGNRTTHHSYTSPKNNFAAKDLMQHHFL